MATDHVDLYSCNICNKEFQLQSMYACYHGHYLCRKCFKHVYYKGKDRQCPHGTCTAFFMQQHGDNNRDEPIERSRLMFPNPCIYSQNLFVPKNSIVSLSSIYKPSLLSLGISSKKPVQCPHNGCNKSIAVSSLDSHFEHEHKHVASIVTIVDARNALEFYFSDLHGRVKTLCLVLIKIDDMKADLKPHLIDVSSMTRQELLLTVPEDSSVGQERSFYSKCSQLGTTIPKPFFIVMAAKITANDMDNTNDDEQAENPNSEFSPVDRIIFFVTSNILTNYSYTISLSQRDQNIRMKYFGPLPTLNEGYKKLFEEGKGLILNHYQVDGMSDYGANNVFLDVIIHEREDDTYDSD